ncbi:PREDICTED: flt3-interacting zinc finger protein 1 isoform X1 [Cercocebus atys]|uniref:flt3-interacting zinc finger protein 1 isoform X1 n=1 Tax=Cercocebus atys TaxID=9531 RepID=UPI0005F38085|nr:PREDICTED: flt3-interacting zinc finger protein 1 isoform X1 [Cercocebus atys]XP_011909024.1 PREDICTED: flt3-interacting zinc finger protein 1 isoform X1 [Cercocebus atys]
MWQELPLPLRPAAPLCPTHSAQAPRVSALRQGLQAQLQPSQPPALAYRGAALPLLRLPQRVPRLHRPAAPPGFLDPGNKMCTFKEAKQALEELEEGQCDWSTEKQKECGSGEVWRMLDPGNTAVVHTGEKPYCCLVCELRFSSRSSLGRHLKRQHRGVLPSPLQPGPGLPALSAPCSVCCNVGPCSVCGGAGTGGGEGPEGAGAGLGSWGLAEAAAAAAASLPPFACGACARRFDHGRELAAHWAAHTDVKPFKCPRCERDFNAPALLERHKLTHDLQGPGAPPAQGWAAGAGAGPETASKSAAAEAGDAPPTSDGRLLLGPAGGGVPKLGGLLPEGGGEAPAPAAAAEPSEDTLYQCDCGTFFASAAALASHLEAHSGPATYGCGHCGALYAALAALEEHRRVSHGEGGAEEAAAAAREGEPASGEPPSGSGRGKKIFGCSECEKLFRSPRDLERHVLVHTGEKPFPCLECGKFFRHECYLKRHRLLHGTERPFPCHICGKGFITLSNLSRHLKLHRGMD